MSDFFIDIGPAPDGSMTKAGTADAFGLAADPWGMVYDASHESFSFPPPPPIEYILIDYQRVIDADGMEISGYACTLIDLNLFSGSSDTFRNEIGGYFYNVEDVSGNVDVNFFPFDKEMRAANHQDWNSPKNRNEYLNTVYSFPLRSNMDLPGTKYQRNKIIPNYKFVVSCDANSAKIPNDKFWKVLWLGGTFDDKQYPGIFNNDAVYDEYYSNYCHPYMIKERDALRNPYAISKYAQVSYNYNAYLPEYQQATAAKDELLLSDVNTNTWAFMYATQSSMAQFPANMHNCLTFDNQMEHSWLTFHSMSAYLVTASSLSYASDTEEWKKKKYRNVMFPNNYYASKLNLSVETSASSYPYAMTIKFPAEMSNNISVTIANKKDDARWLTLLKDVFVDGVANLTPKVTQFAKNKAFITSSGETNTKRSVNESADLRGVDFTEMLLYSHAKIKSTSEDYIFASGYGMQELAAYDTKANFRHLNSSNAVETLCAVVEGFQKEPGVVEFSSLMNLQKETPINQDYHDQFDIDSPDGKIVPDKKYTEVLAYRVDKLAGQEVIQTYWFFNSPYTSEIDLFDTQVKYDKEYTYEAYEYRIIRGLKYRYSDLQLSRIIGAPTAGGSPPLGGLGHLEGSFDGATWSTAASAFDHVDESSPDYFPPYYCIEYYNPYSAEETRTLDLLDSHNYVGWGGELQYADVDTGMAWNDIADGIFDLYGGRMGTLSTDAQRIARARATHRESLTSLPPYYANFLVTVESRLKIFEIPLFSKTLKISDNPPQRLHVQPDYLVDNSNTLKFEVFYEGFAHRKHPVSLEQEDVQRMDSYLHGRDLAENDSVPSDTVSSHQSIQVYRIDFKPTKFTDFEGALIMQESLQIDLPQSSKKYYYLSTCLYDRIPSNKKFYYAFRVVNENGIPGQITEILQAEYVNDGGYKYALFDTLYEEEIKKDEFNKTTETAKKLIQIKPAYQQALLSYGDADFSNTAGIELGDEKISVGTAEDLLWRKTFKFRLTSKKTGKKIDLNVTYKPKPNNLGSE
jgi:hypothetical protein